MMQLFLRFLKNYWYLLLCIFFPVILVYFIYLARGIHPFGDGSVLVLDLNAQYVYFFDGLRNIVSGGADILYSFSRALGGEFMGMYAYYLSSPFSFLVCLFPEGWTLEGLLVMFLIKTAICGGTFGYYMHRTMKKKNPVAIIIFAVCYALSAYGIVQQNNTMWIDAMMWLPLLTLGIESLIKEGKFRLYTIMLALTVFSNFYIGFMVCIYSLIYFFIYYIGHSEEFTNNPMHEKLHFIKSFFRMGFYSIIAVGITAVILLASYYSLNFGKTTFSNPSWEWTTKLDFLELLYKFLPGSYDTVRPEGYPFVYCGLLTLLLVPIYFLSKKFSMRKKITAGVFIMILVASFSFSVPDLIWHGFQTPNWLNYRYSFMLCFLLCVLACHAFEDLSELPLKTMVGTSGLIVLLCVILQRTEEGKYFNPNDLTCIWFTLIALFIYLAIFGISRSKPNSKQVISALLIAVVSVEVFLNGLFCMNALDKDVIFTGYSRYNNFLENTKPIVESVQNSDGSFYRMEKTFRRTINDNMALKIRGLSGSTSTLNQETINFLNKMGYQSRSHTNIYLGGNPVNDSLLGLKYIISDKEIYPDYYVTYKQDAIHKYTAYQNPYALSIAYGVDDDVLEFPMGFVESTDANQEQAEKEEDRSAIANLIDSLKGGLNDWLGIEETIKNAQYIDNYNSPFERMNAIVSAMVGADETVELFVPVKMTDTSKSNLTVSSHVGHRGYTKTDKNRDGVLTYTIYIEKDAEIFFYMPTGYPREVTLALKDLTDSEKEQINLGSYAGNSSDAIVSLGKHEAEDRLALKLTLKQDNLFPMLNENYFYYLDMEVFEEVMAVLAKDQYQITDYTEHSFNGTFTSSREKELVMTTLAYDKGWNVTVDGKEVETVKALGALVAFYIEGNAGQTHNVEIVYSPQPVWVGLTISLISLGILILLIVLRKPLMRVKVLRAVVSIPDYNDKLDASNTESSQNEAKEAQEEPHATEAPNDSETEPPAKEPKEASTEESKEEEKEPVQETSEEENAPAQQIPEEISQKNENEENNNASSSTL